MKRIIPALFALVTAVGSVAAQSATGTTPGNSREAVLHYNDQNTANPYYTFGNRDYSLSLLGNGYLAMMDDMAATAALDANLQQEMTAYRARLATGRTLLLAGTGLAAAGAGYMYYATFSGGGAIGVFSGLGGAIVGVLVGLIGENWAGQPTQFVTDYNVKIAAGSN